MRQGIVYGTKDTRVHRNAGEVTLHDLIAWEPAISLSAAPGGTRLSTQEVDWVITARSSQPMLPMLRGGELIILPNRIVRETGVSFNALVRELGTQPIAGVLTDYDGDVDAGEITVLHVNSIGGDTEATLNRLIATGRRQAQTAIAELDQRIADAAGRQARPSELVDLLSRQLQLPLAIHTGGGAVLFTTGSSRHEPDPASESWLHESFRTGHTLWIGPIPPHRHAIARFGISHVRDALQRALDSTAIAAPRGSARAAALSALVGQTDQDPERLTQMALDAGIPPTAPLRVARSQDVPAATVIRALGHFGDVLDASNDGPEEVWLIVERPDRAQPRYRGPIGQGWIAVSTAVPSVQTLPLAARQARYIAHGQQRGLLQHGTLEFGPELGIHTLLFAGWDSDEQREFYEYHLGQLIENDPRGQLVDTLGAYLDAQGSQGNAAEMLAIHRNTLTYRLRQIEALLPVDLTSPAARLTLHLAITMYRMRTL